MFFSDLSLEEIVYRVIAVLVALTVHEFAHGFAAFSLGDPTAQRQGRLSLNPLRHLDPVGTLLILIVGFGWAKPVEINPRNYRNPRRDMAIVGGAGPLTNIVVGMLLGWLLLPLTGAGAVQTLVFTVILINIYLGVFNLIPIPPLDGSRVVGPFLPDPLFRSYMQLERYGIFILIAILLVAAPVLIAIINPVVNALLNIAI